MGMAMQGAGVLFLTRVKADLEFKQQGLLERKMAILDECNQISANLSNQIFNTGTHGTISTNAAGPGDVFPALPWIPVQTEDWGQVQYEERMITLQAKEKEIDVQLKKIGIELEAVKSELDSLEKSAKDNAKKAGKIG